MVESIDTFVAKLQADGVQAGQEAAAKLQAGAQEQAEQIVDKAKAEAEQIVANAQTEAEQTLARCKTDLELAARDALLQLRAALSRALTGVLAQSVKQPLGDAEFLKGVIHELVRQYASADLEGVSTAEIRLSSEMHKQLVDWAIQELHEAAMGQGVSIDLKDTLGQAGFEYSIEAGTVEVTEESVVATLAALVGPNLRELFDHAAAKA